MSKYLNTKPGSLEAAVYQAVVGTSLTEKTGDKEEYQKFFQAALKKFGVSSPAELKGDKEKEFYSYVDDNWEGDLEEADKKDDKKEPMKPRPAGFAWTKRDPKTGKIIEGTWALPDNPKAQAELKKLMSKPIPANKASNMLYHLIGNDSLADDIGEMEDNNPKADVRPLIKKHMKLLGIKEEVVESNELINSAASYIASMWRDSIGESSKDVKEEEVENSDNGKKTMTGKPMTKIEVSPKEMKKV
jgi:hypothetical protein